MKAKVIKTAEEIKRLAEEYVISRWPELKGKLKQAAIKGYIDGYRSAPCPIVQLELKL